MSDHDNRRLTVTFDGLDIDMALVTEARQAAFKTLQSLPNAPGGFAEMSRADWDYVFGVFVLLLAKAESERKWKSPIAYAVDLNRRKFDQIAQASLTETFK